MTPSTFPGFPADFSWKIERFQMPSSRGRRVPDKFMCAFGHLHPGRNHAVKCHERKRLEARKGIK